jgi:hypothetical protein
MLLVTYMWHKADTQKSYLLVRGENSLAKVLLESVVAFGLFTLTSTFLLSGAAPKIFAGVQSIFQLLSSSTPILQGSKILTLLGWGVVIPFVETILFFVIVQEGVADWYASATSAFSQRSYNVKMIFVVMFVALLFTIFHLTAKGLQTVPLLITFVFGLVSGLLVVRQGEARGAILIHVVTNSLAVLSTLGN